MASTTHKRRMAPRPATDPHRWSRVTGGRNIRRKPKQTNLQKAMAMLPISKKATPSKGSRKGTAGKAAMVTAAAGLAYKMFNKRRGGGQPSV